MLDCVVLLLLSRTHTIHCLPIQDPILQSKYWNQSPLSPPPSLLGAVHEVQDTIYIQDTEDILDYNAHMTSFRKVLVLKWIWYIFNFSMFPFRHLEHSRVRTYSMFKYLELSISISTSSLHDTLTVPGLKLTFKLGGRELNPTFTQLLLTKPFSIIHCGGKRLGHILA